MAVSWAPPRSDPNLELPLVFTRKSLAVLVTGIFLPVSALPVLIAGSAAGASAPASAKQLAKYLLPVNEAKKAGFTKVVEKVTTSSKTGEKSCPHGAQEAFEDASGQTGLVSEVVACTTAKAATLLLTGVKKATTASTTGPPKRLGSSAFERTSGGSTYTIYWQRGQTLALVGLTTNVPASSSSTSTSTTAVAPPITAPQQAILSKAALRQDARIKR